VYCPPPRSTGSIFGSAEDHSLFTGQPGSGLGLQLRLKRQASPHVGIVIGPVQPLLKPPVQQVTRARRALNVQELQKRCLDIRFGQNRSLSVLFEREQAKSESVGIMITEEEAAVLAQGFDHRRFLVPSQRRPDKLVDVVVAALVVVDETNRFALGGAKHRRILPGAGVDRLAPFGRGKGKVPFHNHVMAPNTYSCIDGTGGHLLSGAWTAQSRHPGGVNVCFGDGSVHFIKQSISLPVWWGIGGGRAQGRNR
jgi:prepilin-type processing-associated H-X9-DG protein